MIIELGNNVSEMIVINSFMPHVHKHLKTYNDVWRHKVQHLASILANDSLLMTNTINISLEHLSKPEYNNLFSDYLSFGKTANSPQVELTEKNYRYHGYICMYLDDLLSKIKQHLTNRKIICINEDNKIKTLIINKKAVMYKSIFHYDSCIVGETSYYDLEKSTIINNRTLCYNNISVDISMNINIIELIEYMYKENILNLSINKNELRDHVNLYKMITI